MQWHPHPVAITITMARPTNTGTRTAAMIEPTRVSNANKKILQTIKILHDHVENHQFLGNYVDPLIIVTRNPSYDA